MATLGAPPAKADPARAGRRRARPEKCKRARCVCCAPLGHVGGIRREAVCVFCKMTRESPYKASFYNATAFQQITVKLHILACGSGEGLALTEIGLCAPGSPGVARCGAAPGLGRCNSAGSDSTSDCRRSGREWQTRLRSRALVANDASGAVCEDLEIETGRWRARRDEAVIAW